MEIAPMTLWQLMFATRGCYAYESVVHSYGELITGALVVVSQREIPMTGNTRLK